MRILLTTIVDNINFGTYLQAYATVRKLEERGHSVDVLNYIRPYLSGKVYARNCLKDHSRNVFMRYLYAVGHMVLNSFSIWQVKRFLTKHAKLTRKCFSLEEVQRLAGSIYDLYLTGSDQVWNSQHNRGLDGVFFWAGIKGRKAAYAASIGFESFPEEEREPVCRLLSDYAVISVRESFGVKALSQVGIRNVRQALDPTLLLTKNEWSTLSKHRFKKNAPYLLVYSVEPERDSTVIAIARKIASERGLKVFWIYPTLKLKSQANVDRIFSFASVECFLSLFEQADYVVVSSFHGTAFAINFNKQFVTIAPERFSTRVNSLLQLLRLENRYIQNERQIPESDIDYAKVNGILQEERNKSMEVIDLIGSLD